MAHPCCGSSLQRGVKIMAIIDIVFGAIGLISLTFFLVAAIALLDNSNYDTSREVVKVAIAVAVISILIGIFSLAMAVILLKGSEKRDMSRCKTWFTFMCVIVTIYVAIFILNAATGALLATYIAVTVLSILYRLYMLWVVYAFIEELKISDTSNMGRI